MKNRLVTKSRLAAGIASVGVGLALLPAASAGASATNEGGGSLTCPAVFARVCPAIQAGLNDLGAAFGTAAEAQATQVVEEILDRLALNHNETVLALA